jgi:hypothetical protein
MASLNFALQGDLQYTLGLADGRLLSYSKWLGAVASMVAPKAPGFIDGFVSASSAFEGQDVSGSVRALAPFEDQDIEQVQGSLDSFQVDLINLANNAPKPNLVVNLLQSIRNLSFQDVAHSIQEALRFILGDDANGVLESCSQGLLSNDLVSYRIPGKSPAVIDACFLSSPHKWPLC